MCNHSSPRRLLCALPPHTHVNVHSPGSATCTRMHRHKLRTCACVCGTHLYKSLHARTWKQNHFLRDHCVLHPLRMQGAYDLLNNLMPLRDPLAPESKDPGRVGTWEAEWGHLQRSRVDSTRTRAPSSRSALSPAAPRPVCHPPQTQQLCTAEGPGRSKDTRSWWGLAGGISAEKCKAQDSWGHSAAC